jgi:hypothetical protein
MLGDKPGTCAGLISDVPAGTGRATSATQPTGEHKFFEEADNKRFLGVKE